MSVVQTVEELEAIYGHASKASIVKVSKQITPEYRAWIASSRLNH